MKQFFFQSGLALSFVLIWYGRVYVVGYLWDAQEAAMHLFPILKISTLITLFLFHDYLFTPTTINIIIINIIPTLTSKAKAKLTKYHPPRMVDKRGK